MSALEALISRGYTVDTMEVSGSWADLPAIYAATVEALRAVEGTLAAGAHQSHSYPSGGCLYFTFAGQVAPEARDTYYRALWDAGQRAVLAHGGSLSHHHGVGLNRARFMPRGAGRGVRRAGGHQGRPRPPRHPQPRQARPPLALGRGGLVSMGGPLGPGDIDLLAVARGAGVALGVGVAAALAAHALDAVGEDGSPLALPLLLVVMRGPGRRRVRGGPGLLRAPLTHAGPRRGARRSPSCCGQRRPPAARRRRRPLELRRDLWLPLAVAAGLAGGLTALRRPRYRADSAR